MTGNGLRSQHSRESWYWYVLPILVAGYLFVKCMYVMLSRFSYPYELDWIEGGMLQSVARIVDGLPLYAPPSMEYVPPLYAPFYFYLSAAATWLWGVSLPALRFVSLVSALGTMLLITFSTWQLTRSKWATLLSALCWAAGYQFSGTYYDVARVDSLLAFFLTAAVAFLVVFIVHRKKYCIFYCVASLVAAIFTKQTSLVVLPFFLLAVWMLVGFRFAALAGVGAMLAISIVGIFFQNYSDGWFFFYTIEMARTHEFNKGFPANFIYMDILFGSSVYVLLSILFVFMQKDFKYGLAWLFVFSGFFFMSLLSRWYSGGWFNVLIPLHALFAIMAVSGFYKVLRRAGRLLFAWLKIGIPLIAMLLLTCNLAIGYFNASSLLPTIKDRQCGDTLVKRIAAVDGNVCILRHDYLAILAGKKVPCAHEAFVVDLLNGSDKSLAESLLKDIRSKLLAGRYAVLSVDSDGQFKGYGVKWHELPYTATDIADCAVDAFYPKMSGQRPRHWLEYNGRAMDDRRTSVKH